MQTPHGSDDESSEDELGDYDDVLGRIPGYVSPSSLRKRSRSLANSYADLQQLKRNGQPSRHLHPEDHHLRPKNTSRTPSPPPPVPPLPSTTNGGPPSPTASHRERKNSLSDNVAVNRLAQLDPQEPFKECTEDINREVSMRRRVVTGDGTANGDSAEQD